MDRLERFRIFARVLECCSFTEAANSLGIPRSTTSLAVQELEARVGIQLLNRTTRRVAPTPEGVEVYDRIVRVLADFEETERLFRHGAQPRGRLRVNAPSRIARRVIAPALPDFLARFPEIEVEISGTDRATDILDERVDCVVRVGGVIDPRVNSRRLGDVAVVTCASPSYLEVHGTPSSVDDLRHHQIVRFASSFSQRTDEFLLEGTGRSLTLRGQVCVDNAETYVACCIAGLGLIQVPAFDVQDELLSGRLVEVLLDVRAPAKPIALLWPHQHPPSRRTQVFIDWVSQLIGREVLAGSAN